MVINFCSQQSACCEWLFGARSRNILKKRPKTHRCRRDFPNLWTRKTWTQYKQIFFWVEFHKCFTPKHLILRGYSGSNAPALSCIAGISGHAVEMKNKSRCAVHTDRVVLTGQRTSAPRPKSDAMEILAWKIWTHESGNQCTFHMCTLVWTVAGSKTAQLIAPSNQIVVFRPFSKVYVLSSFSRSRKTLNCRVFVGSWWWVVPHKTSLCFFRSVIQSRTSFEKRETSRAVVCCRGGSHLSTAGL